MVKNTLIGKFAEGEAAAEAVLEHEVLVQHRRQFAEVIPRVVEGVRKLAEGAENTTAPLMQVFSTPGVESPLGVSLSPDTMLAFNCIPSILSPGENSTLSMIWGPNAPFGLRAVSLSVFPGERIGGRPMLTSIGLVFAKRLPFPFIGHETDGNAYSILKIDRMGTVSVAALECRKMSLIEQLHHLPESKDRNIDAMLNMREAEEYLLTHLPSLGEYLSDLADLHARTRG